MDCRKIIHIDMDAFYASVEQRDNPKLKGKPVIVGGPPNSRGVVSTCSYEARKFGVHSAMPSAHAKRLCPNGIFIFPRFHAYSEASSVIRSIFREYTDLVEPLSLDEAFLDVTFNKKEERSATIIAREIQRKIFDATRLSSSAGVSYNKFLAKTASDFKKPAGLTVIRPIDAEKFIEDLPIGKFFGIGKVTEMRMKEMGINCGRDLKERSYDFLMNHFGKAGRFYYKIVRGIDNRPVESRRIRKSIGKERTFSSDIIETDKLKGIISSLTDEVTEYMQHRGIKGKTVSIKVKYDDFEVATRSRSLDSYVNDERTIYSTAVELMDSTEAGLRRVRLMGVTMSNLDNSQCDDENQLLLPFREFVPELHP